LFAVYLTPKALRGIRAKDDNFSRIIKEAKQLSKRKKGGPAQSSDLN
jgi:hypothetical protein